MNILAGILQSERKYFTSTHALGSSNAKLEAAELSVHPFPRQLARMVAYNNGNMG